MDEVQRKAVLFIENILNDVREGKLRIAEVKVNREIETVYDGIISIGLVHTGVEIITFVVHPRKEDA